MSHRRSPTVRRLAVLAGALLGLCAVTARSGTLDAPAAPSSAASALYTLEDLYNRLDSGAAGAKRGGAFVEPASGPAPSMDTLDALMAAMPALDATNGAAPGDVASGKTYWGLTAGGWGPRTGTGAGGVSAAVPKTGQTPTDPLNPAPAGSDGALQKGVAWPNPRFTDNSDGTVTDNLTGLIWLKNANCFAPQTWANALTKANALYDGCTNCGGTNNDCGLSDGSTVGQWRLPNRKELDSLIDSGRSNPALPSGHPFSDVQTTHVYWSSTSDVASASVAWGQYLVNGHVYYDDKSYNYDVWPVRGGQ